MTIAENSRRAAFRFVVLLGIVSLFADLTYEGARSINGPFLGALGASGTAVGLIAGMGELIGYGLRILSGQLADRTRRYWLIVFLGYGVNVLAVPLLALAGRWEVAAALMIAERIGKALRAPARDAMLSQATHQIGHGSGFGLHEALDQIGAVAGPLLVAGILLSEGGPRAAYAVLLVPALCTLGALVVAWRQFPDPRQLESGPTGPSTSRAFPTRFWIYTAASGLIAAGFADFPLIAYHLDKHAVLPTGRIPILYAWAMGVDALAALGLGWLFDRRGPAVLIASTLLSTLFAPLAFLGGLTGALAGSTLWAIGMGAQESILRAAVAGMVPPDRRGTAFGIFNAFYGLSWFLGSLAMGWLYDVSTVGLIAFSIVVQLAAVPLLVIVARRPRAFTESSTSGG